MTTPAITACLECDGPLSPADTGGLCPKCLLKLGLATQLAEGRFAALAEGLRPDGSVDEPFTFGNYHILRLLGKGGMGAVYEAEQSDTGRRVALKVLGKSLDTPEMRQRFLREGQLAASVRHNHVVSVLAAEEIEETPVIVMELLHDGTLKDRVTRRGPLPVREAVDAILQIVDGLEAAHAVGVLHRDVKPGNCFANAEGVVKVGDFGLSISTLAKAEQSLTKSGAVLGTPSFAAPEQLRGEEIDSRADIYAVGATLYYLLSGKPAFEGESLVALIAAVLEKRPVDVRALRLELPRALGRTVMRCLEKDRGRRFGSYAALRAALIPYSSAATAPATLGLRFVAGALDSLVLSAPYWLAALFGRELPTWAIEQGAFAALLFFAGVVAGVLWYAVPEALWGCSLGKWLCGLRVVQADGGPVGWGAALARSVIFAAPDVLSTAISALIFTAAEIQEGKSGLHSWVLGAVFLAYWVTMRRSNGFAAVHDLATRTRVVLDRPAEEEELDAETFVAGGGGDWGEAVGPYRLLRREGNLGEAFDPSLRRRVWVRFHPPGTPPLPEPRKLMARGTRLHWLLGRRGAEENWDVFEQPAGQPLTALIGTRQSWSRARLWLADLARELRAGMADGSIPPNVSLAHVWISRGRHAVLLDFPAPGVEAMPGYPMTSVGQMQDFLSAAAHLVVSPVQPLGARQFLDALRRRAFEASAIVAGNLQALIARPAFVDRARRALNILLVPALFVLASLVDLPSDGKAFDAEWQQSHPGQPSPRHALELLPFPFDDGDPQHARVATHLAQAYGGELVEDAFWQKPSVRKLVERGEIRRFPATMLIARALGDAERAASAASAPATSSVEAPPDVERLLARAVAHEAGHFPRLHHAFMALCGAHVLALICVAIFGIPLTTRLLGIAVICDHGEKAGRLRMLFRSVVAALPVLLAGVILLVRDQPHFATPMPVGWLAAALVASFTLIVLLSILPRRALEDRLARTWLVPR